METTEQFGIFALYGFMQQVRDGTCLTIRETPIPMYFSCSADHCSVECSPSISKSLFSFQPGILLHLSTLHATYTISVWVHCGNTITNPQSHSIHKSFIKGIGD